MKRWVGVQGDHITWISDSEPSSLDNESLELPEDFSKYDENVLLSELRYRNGVFYLKGKRKPLRVAIVSLWGVNCGISTYTEDLVQHFGSVEDIEQIYVFAETAEKLRPGFVDSDLVNRAWNRTTLNVDIPQLRAKILEFDPDVIYVQHEYGTFGYGAVWNTLLSALRTVARTVVTLHSVYDHEAKLLFEAACDEIIVHHSGARDLLRLKGITCPVHYIPHGCHPVSKKEYKWSQTGTNKLVFQFGFGFEYKGWTKAIQAIVNLLPKYPDLFYIGIFNVSVASEEFHRQYFNQLQRQITDNNAGGNIALLWGFRSEDVLDSYLNQSDILLFPYWNHHEWKVYGASGALRRALRSGKPAVIGDVPFFEEYKGVLPVANTTEDIATELEKLINDQSYYEEIQNNVISFMDKYSWARIAEHYLAVLRMDGKDYDAK